MEFPDIGARCEVPDCKQLDFLPFECNVCNRIFCVKHKSRQEHNCSVSDVKEVVNCDTQPPKHENSALPCGFTECGALELTLVYCSKCGVDFCIRHRHPEDHNCPDLIDKKDGVKKQGKQTIIKPSTLGRVGKRSSETALKVRMMKLKMKSKGDDGIPQAERMYFNITTPEHLKAGELPVFLNKNWTIGRAIDQLASTYKMTNENNKDIGKKLRLFCADHMLPPDARLDELLNTVAGFEQGGTLSLRYV